MAYAIHKAGAQEPPEDGGAIGWRAISEDDELEGYEVYLEDIPEGMSEPRWDGEKLRARTDEEMAEAERETTLERVAGQAEESLASAFVNPNDVLGLVASMLYRIKEDLPLASGEEAALAGLNQMYEHSLEKTSRPTQKT